MQMAEVMLEVEGKTRPLEVIVMEGSGREVLLGVDHPVTRSLFGRGSFIVNGDDPIPEEGTYDRAGVLPFDKPTVEIVGIPSDNTLDVRAITSDNTIDVSAITSDNTIDVRAITSDNTIDVRAITSDNTIDVCAITSDNTIDVHAITSDNTIDVRAITSDNTIDVRAITSDNTIDVRAITSDNTIDVRAITSDNTIDVRAINSDNTIDVCAITSDNTIDVHAITRAMSLAQEAELAQHIAANAKDGAVSIPLSLPKSAATLKCRQRRSKFCQNPTILTPDPCANPAGSDDIVGEVEMAGSPSACPQEEDGSGDKGIVEREGEEDLADRVVEADCIVWLEGIEPEGEPLLPDLAQDREGVVEVITQQRDDEMLSEIRKRAKREEQGFYFNEEVLMHSKIMEHGREAASVVVPLARRTEVMSAGHRGLVEGHFSHNRMATHLKQSFTWPGLDRDVRKFCATCPERQKAGKPLLPRVPMVETPIISVPYHHMAFDIVGPLKRTKRGYDRILTAVCMGTCYPYCVPLRGDYTIFPEICIFFCNCHNVFPLSSVQIIIIPACCLLCVL